jgi:hypothetical protein
MSCHRAVGVRSFRLPRRGQPACPLAELQSGFPSSEFHRNAFVKRLGILQILAAMLISPARISRDDKNCGARPTAKNANASRVPHLGSRPQGWLKGSNEGRVPIVSEPMSTGSPASFRLFPSAGRDGAEHHKSARAAIHPAVNESAITQAPTARLLRSWGRSVAYRFADKVAPSHVKPRGKNRAHTIALHAKPNAWLLLPPKI